ncbi:HlyD family efflux transporter periplasmic adaptor subunit [uncultured Alteromonas sp.]|uniref:HlyD family secretion protein n=1 Tax=uncultured Alteromonas sp. TaxID=179113 RepID=UPI0030EC4DB1|tara:strand:+ start:46370 stop:47614 length:1245 start_codon:yes stop_codon:yes gene_type:complete
MNTIFRKEALQHIVSQNDGHVLKTPPLLLKVFSGLLCIFFAGLLLVIFNFEYARYELASGMLVSSGKSSRLTAQRSGVISQLHVNEGDNVVEGDVLLTINPTNFDSVGNNTIENLIFELDSSIALLRKREVNLNQRLVLQSAQVMQEKSRLEMEIQQQKQLLDTQKDVVLLIAAERDAAQTLFKQKRLSRTEFNLQEREYLDSKITLNQHQIDIQTLQFKLNATQNKLALLQNEVDSARQDIQLEVNELKRQVHNLRSQSGYQVRAPISGTVSGLLLKTGSSITPDSFLLSIVPADLSLMAEMYVPSNSIGFIKQNLDVNLRYFAYPYEKFGSYKATVSNISKTVILPKDHFDRSGLDVPAYSVYLQLEHQYVKSESDIFPLYPGMQVEVYLASERRTLAEWFFRPLFSISSRN